MDLSLMVFRATRFTIDCQMSCKGNGIDRQTIESVNRQVMAAHQTSQKCIITRLRPSICPQKTLAENTLIGRLYPQALERHDRCFPSRDIVRRRSTQQDCVSATVSWREYSSSN